MPEQTLQEEQQPLGGDLLVTTNKRKYHVTKFLEFLKKSRHEICLLVFIDNLPLMNNRRILHLIHTLHDYSHLKL